MQNDRTVHEPRPAATILLLRDEPEFQVLMVKRHQQIDFASGALVFPGGKLHEGDADPAWPNTAADGPNSTRFSGRFGLPRSARFSKRREFSLPTTVTEGFSKTVANRKFAARWIEAISPSWTWPVT